MRIIVGYNTHKPAHTHTDNNHTHTHNHSFFSTSRTGNGNFFHYLPRSEIIEHKWPFVRIHSP